MIKITQYGDFEKTTNILHKWMNKDLRNEMNSWGKRGVEALAAATPKDTGHTAESWSYSLVETDGGYNLSWSNSATNKGVHIAVLLQYGHATRSGSWVPGYDYINPALQPIYDEIDDWFKWYF